MPERDQGRQRRPTTTGGDKSDRDNSRQPSSSHHKDDVHGEGNYKASREFDQAEREFVQSGKLDEGIRNAAPKSEAERREMESAEEQARRRAKEEDPALLRKPPADRHGKN